MKIILLSLFAVTLFGCATTQIKCPSTVDVSQALQKANSSAQAAKQNITGFNTGTNTIDYKANRALDYF